MIAVTDAGQGIPAEEIAQLFQRYQRARVRPTGAEQSTGLGLAICKRIVDLHGGEITIESVVGQGSTFTVRLPDSLILPTTGAT